MRTQTSPRALYTPLGRRAVAGATDLIAYLLLQIIWSLCIAIVAEGLDNTAASVVLITILGYGVPLLVWSHFASRGPTPGERIAGIRVVRTDGSRPTLWLAMLRTVTFIVGAMCAMLGPGMILLTESRRGLHDILTGTTVTRRWPWGHCADCGYNLEGNVTGICPECGRAFDPRPVRTDIPDGHFRSAEKPSH